MPMEFISGGLDTTAAVLTQVNMYGTDSRVIRNFDKSKKAFLFDLHASTEDISQICVKSPLMHDNVDGIRNYLMQAYRDDNIIQNVLQPLFPQDNLDILCIDTIGVAEWNNIGMNIYYEDLSGSNGKFVTADSLKGKIKNIIHVNWHRALVHLQGYVGESNLAGITDLMRANTDYVLLGCLHLGDQFAVCLRGPDTGNMRIGFISPVVAGIKNLVNWYQKSIDSGLPIIPVINSGNRYATFIDFVNDHATTVNHCELIFGEI